MLAPLPLKPYKRRLLQPYAATSYHHRFIDIVGTGMIAAFVTVIFIVTFLSASSVLRW